MPMIFEVHHFDLSFINHGLNLFRFFLEIYGVEKDNTEDGEER
jgi:hypothetical protein